MKKRIIWVGLLSLIALLGGAWWLTHRATSSGQIVLYGNVDLREVDLAFNDTQRIDSVLVQEGDRVHKGEVLARLDTSRLAPRLAQAQAQAAAQQAVLERLRHGSRPQEIAQARANLLLTEANARQARDNRRRIEALYHGSSGRAVSRQAVDDAIAQSDVAEARVTVSRKALQLALLGPRREDVAQAQAILEGEQAQVALLRQELADAQLRAPLDAVVRSRIAEPGDMASPQKTAFTLALTDPKWVRAYVSEPDLGRVRPGMLASIVVDSYPGKRFEGWVGFISPVAEFTPKTVQTPDLRTSLVYEIRVFVKDPADQLRLGMPATVYLSAAPARS
jgi:HlyD family secretion protein